MNGIQVLLKLIPFFMASNLVIGAGVECGVSASTEECLKLNSDKIDNAALPGVKADPRVERRRQMWLSRLNRNLAGSAFHDGPDSKTMESH